MNIFNWFKNLFKRNEPECSVIDLKESCECCNFKETLENVETVDKESVCEIKEELKIPVKTENKSIENKKKNTPQRDWTLKNGTLNFNDSVKTIEKYQFKNNANIKKIIFPNSLETIEKGAFFGCENLKKIVFKNDMQNIPNIYPEVFSTRDENGKLKLLNNLNNIEIPQERLEDFINANGWKKYKKLFNNNLKKK